MSARIPPLVKFEMPTASTIQVSTSYNPQSGTMMIFALRSDGTIWQKSSFLDSKWEKLPPVPKG